MEASILVRATTSERSSRCLAGAPPHEADAFGKMEADTMLDVEAYIKETSEESHIRGSQQRREADAVRKRQRNEPGRRQRAEHNFTAEQLQRIAANRAQEFLRAYGFLGDPKNGRNQHASRHLDF